MLKKKNLCGRKSRHPQGEAVWAGTPPLKPDIPKTHGGNAAVLPCFSSRVESDIHHLSGFLTGITWVVQMPLD